MSESSWSSSPGGRSIRSLDGLTAALAQRSANGFQGPGAPRGAFEQSGEPVGVAARAQAVAAAEAREARGDAVAEGRGEADRGDDARGAPEVVAGVLQIDDLEPREERWLTGEEGVQLRRHGHARRLHRGGRARRAGPGEAVLHGRHPHRAELLHGEVIAAPLGVLLQEIAALHAGEPPAREGEAEPALGRFGEDRAEHLAAAVPVGAQVPDEALQHRIGQPLRHRGDERPRGGEIAPVAIALVRGEAIVEGEGERAPQAEAEAPPVLAAVVQIAHARIRRGEHAHARLLVEVDRAREPRVVGVAEQLLGAGERGAEASVGALDADEAAGVLLARGAPRDLVAELVAELHLAEDGADLPRPGARRDRAVEIAHQHQRADLEPLAEAAGGAPIGLGGGADVAQVLQVEARRAAHLDDLVRGVDLDGDLPEVGDLVEEVLDDVARHRLAAPAHLVPGEQRQRDDVGAHRGTSGLWRAASSRQRAAAVTALPDAESAAS